MDLNEVLKLGFLTGSRYFGVGGVNSDWDIIVMNTAKLPIEALADDVEIGSGEYMFGNTSNVKCIVDTTLFNFIIFKDIELHDCLIDTSKIIKDLGQEFYADKEVRHRVFEAINYTLQKERGLLPKDFVIDVDEDDIIF